MLSVGIAPPGLLIWEQFRRLLLTLPPSWRSEFFAHECETRQGGAGRAVVFQRKWSNVTLGWSYSPCNAFRKGDAPQKGKTADERSLKLPWVFAWFFSLWQQGRLAVALCELVVWSLYLLVFWWMANASLGINSPRLHLQEQDTELWNPQGVGKAAFNCDVVPLSLALHNLHFHIVLWEDRGPGREGSSCTPCMDLLHGFHVQGPAVSALFWVIGCLKASAAMCTQCWSQDWPPANGSFGSCQSFWCLQQCAPWDWTHWGELLLCWR